MELGMNAADIILVLYGIAAVVMLVLWMDEKVTIGWHAIGAVFHRPTAAGCKKAGLIKQHTKQESHYKAREGTHTHRNAPPKHSGNHRSIHST